MQVRFLLATTAAAVSLLPLSAQAATLFGTGGIEFDQATTVRFTFQGSSNFYASSVSVYIVNPTSGFVDTTSRVPLFGESPGAFQDVTFLPGFRYTLGLSNINPNDGTAGLSPIVFSTTQSNNATNLGRSDNPNIGLQRAVFGSFGSTTEGTPFPNPGSFTSGNPFAGPVLISFEDGGFDASFNGLGGLNVTVPNDRDFNDFRFTAQVIPAPPLLMGLLALGARVFFRQRKSVRT
ncbi:hypothetical protein [Leptodesmis sp.]|uniref:hypothetical protein n=1 Tax=Leptodesmis sp. TaxID=3100501 RepID=UPI004053476E